MRFIGEREMRSDLTLGYDMNGPVRAFKEGT
jgi:hypothetical protein